MNNEITTRIQYDSFEQFWTEMNTKGTKLEKEEQADPNRYTVTVTVKGR